jgi:hypothetical protein
MAVFAETKMAGYLSSYTKNISPFSLGPLPIPPCSISRSQSSLSHKFPSFSLTQEYPSRQSRHSRGAPEKAEVLTQASRVETAGSEQEKVLPWYDWPPRTARAKMATKETGKIDPLLDTTLDRLVIKTCVCGGWDFSDTVVLLILVAQI